MEVQEDIKQIQKVIFEIFTQIISLCDKHNIEYFIIGGTALGAVRHKGFIPWDDDLDIGMTRKNYEHFLEIAKKELPKDLFLQNFNTETNTPFYFSKIRKNNTKLVEYYSRNLKIHQGLFIDIFPYDNMPDNASERKKHIKDVNFWINLFIAKTLTGSSIPQKGIIGHSKLLIRFILHYLLIFVSKNFLFNKIEKVIQKYNHTESEYKAYIKLPNHKIRSNNLKQLKKIEFEGKLVSCSNNIEDYLSNCFGDYMKLPPENERVGHRPYILEI